MSANERERVRALIELVPDEDLPTLARMLAGLAVEPGCVSLEMAPEDDEPVTREDIEAQAEARADVATGRVYSHEEAKRLVLAEGC